MEGGRGKCQTRTIVWHADVLARTDSERPVQRGFMRWGATGAARSGKRARGALTALFLLCMRTESVQSEDVISNNRRGFPAKMLGPLLGGVGGRPMRRWNQTIRYGRWRLTIVQPR